MSHSTLPTQEDDWTDRHPRLAIAAGIALLAVAVILFVGVLLWAFGGRNPQVEANLQACSDSGNVIEEWSDAGQAPRDGDITDGELTKAMATAQREMQQLSGAANGDIAVAMQGVAIDLGAMRDAFAAGDARGFETEQRRYARHLNELEDMCTSL